MVVNIPKNLTAGELDNGYKIRRAAIDLNIPLITNARLASAFINAFCTIVALGNYTYRCGGYLVRLNLTVNIPMILSFVHGKCLYLTHK